MDYKERYMHALERAEIYKNHCIEIKDNNGIVGELEYIFPELKESEDELTWLTQFIQEEVYNLSIDIRDNEDRIKLKNLQRSLDWLKKQVSKKPTLNDEDEKMFDEVINNLHNYIFKSDNTYSYIDCDKHITWLKSLKDRVQPQPKQEWSEDDERIITALMEGFRYHQLFNPRFGEVPNTEIISWIKSLKERLS